MVTIVFYFFSTLTLLAALFVVVNRNTVNSAMCMIVAFVGVAALFVLLQAYFLAMLQIVVYAGAVMVLFLFIIMLLDTQARERVRFGRADIVAGAVAFICLAFGAVWLARHYPVGVTPPPAPAMPPSDNPLAYATSAKAFGYGLFTRYLLPFQVTGFLLLIAMVGVILLSNRLPPPDSGVKPDSP
jgi:NADH-quinone oxidoreductase subunit J